MAKQVKLKAERRTGIGRSAARKLKARGVIPAIIYGGRDKPQPLQVSARDVNAMLSHASGENIFFTPSRWTKKFMRKFRWKQSAPPMA